MHLIFKPRTIFSLTMLCTVVVGCQVENSGAEAGTSSSTVTDTSTDTTPGTPDNPTQCSGMAEAITIEDAQTLRPLVEAPGACLLYGIDQSAEKLYVIDTNDDIIISAIELGGAPTDIVLSSDGLYVFIALEQTSEIIQIDVATNMLSKRFSTNKSPYRLTAGPARTLFYVEKASFSAIHSVDMRSETETKLSNTDFHEPALDYDPDESILWVGESKLQGSELFKFGIESSTSALEELGRFSFDGGYGLPAPARQVLRSKVFPKVYYGDRAIDQETPTRVHGWFGDQPLGESSDGKIILTESALFDSLTMLRFANRLHPGGGALFSADGQWLYEFNPVGSQLYRTAVSTLVGVHQLGRREVPPGPLSQRSFTQLITDPDPAKRLLYALDTQQNQLVFIDTETLLPTRAEIIGSAPTHMALHPQGDKIAVATFGATQIAILDLSNSSKLLSKTLWVPSNPFHLVYGSDSKIIYAEQDAFGDLVLVSDQDGEVGGRLNESLYQAGLAMEDNILYAGESAQEQSRLLRMNMATEPFDLDNAQTSVERPSFPTRSVILKGDFVYYAGAQFNAETLEKMGDFGDEIVALSPDGTRALSQTHVYSTDCLCETGGLPADSAILAVDPGGEKVYQFDNRTGRLFVENLP